MAGEDVIVPAPGVYQPDKRLPAMPYSPPSSAFTAVDVPHFTRPTQGDLPSSQTTRRTRNPSASMLNFSTERGPGAHKPLRGLPRRVKSASRPVSVDLTAPTVSDASVPRSMAAVTPPAMPQPRSRGRAKFSVGDDDSSESTSGSPKGSPSTEHGPDDLDRASQSDTTPTPTPQPGHPAWNASASSPRASPSIAKTLSIDTSASYPSQADESQSEKTVPFPMFSPEPVRTEPPTRLPAMIPLGALSHFTSSFANDTDDVENPSPMIRSASSSMIPGSPSAFIPASAQKSLHMNGSGHGRSASLADVASNRQGGRFSPPESGANTPVIRKSNGQPLKPSLKSSLSSPNISAMSGPRPIAKSAPATPRVHFKELGLESVVLFDKGARPVAVSGEYGGADDTETETEQETGRGFPFPRVPAGSALVRLAPTTTQLAFQPPPQSHVHLQYLTLPPVRPPRLHGTVLVRNVSFGKTVVVRYTTDNWETASEIMATFSASLPSGIVPGGGDVPWDKFTFTIKLDDIERNLPNRTLFCVVRYDAHGVGEWWDNNNGQNYRVDFERPAGSSGEVISKPNASGDQSSAPKPFNAVTYSAPGPAPPAPLTKPRSYSTSVVAPPAPIKMSAPASGGPVPHLLHLRLSNYVSPTMNVVKAPLPGKPFEKQAERSNFSPPSSPPHAKAPLPTNDLGVDFQPETREVAPLKMPATLTPPDSVDNSPSPSPPMKHQPLLPSSSLSQSQSGLLSPSSSPSTSMLLTGPSSPSSQDDAAEVAKTMMVMELKDDETPMSPSGTLLNQSYSELLNRFCFHQSSPGGTPTGAMSPYNASSAPLLGALGMSNGYLVNSPKSSPRGGSPAGSGANSPAIAAKNGLPRGGSFVLGTPGTAGPAFTKWNPPSGLAGL
ncbi:hypothetical protein BDV93DRAFT_557622 [Ceratobasidium sp. AG-I]|nr:hypothetical protein BDV93DRAFT_557622 [Ceratobasidium sp. AG-I]